LLFPYCPWPVSLSAMYDTHNTNIWPSAWCKFIVPASEWPQAYALGRAGTRIEVRTADCLDHISLALHTAPLQLRNVRTKATASALATSWNVPVSILKSDIFSRTCRWAVVTTECGSSDDLENLTSRWRD
jgi:hypothetical protein